MNRSHINFNIDFNSFYKNFKDADFREITGRKLIELKCFSKQFNNYWRNNLEEDIRYKYITIMNKIKTAPFKYRATNEAEKFILFMYSVDPTFELFKIWGEYNTLEEIKENVLNKIGIYDKNLYLIEKLFIKNFLSADKQKEIYEEINDRIYNHDTKKIR